MPDRLSALDASFLYLEEPTTAMHVGSVMIFDGEGALDYDTLVALVSDRIGDDSRYRQRVRELPGRISGPVWVDDVDFDISYHVRRSALPAPGLDEQLAEFVARIQSRPLDRQHPLWECYLVEGLAQGRTAIVTKTHQAMVDGVTAVDIGHLLLDEHPSVEVPPLRTWTARREPRDLQLVAGAVTGFVRRPLTLVERIRGGLGEAWGTAHRTLDTAGSLVTQVARTAAMPAPASALNVRVGAPRRYQTLHTDLDRFRAVREAMGEGGRPVDVTVTDVALGALTGGLRTWLQSRGEPVHSATTVRAMVPVSIAEGESTRTDASSQVVACFVDLPVGEPGSRVRLERIAYQTRHQAGSSRAVSASTLAGLAGFAPSTLHHLGARVGNVMSRRMFNVLVTNVPGPQIPLYVAGARMLATYPVQPLMLGHGLSIGLTSYDGQVYFGFNGDRAAMTDLDVLADGVVEALGDLEEATGAATPDSAGEVPPKATDRTTAPAGHATGAAPVASAGAARTRPGTATTASATRTAGRRPPTGRATPRRSAASRATTRTTVAKKAAANRAAAKKAARGQAVTQKPTTQRATTRKAAADDTVADRSSARSASATGSAADRSRAPEGERS